LRNLKKENNTNYVFHKSSWGQEMMYTPQKFSQSHDPLQKFANPSKTLPMEF
jgi:hypothetical protein